MVNEPSVCESLKFYCILAVYLQKLECLIYKWDGNALSSATTIAPRFKYEERLFNTDGKCCIRNSCGSYIKCLKVL